MIVVHLFCFRFSSRWRDLEDPGDLSLSTPACDMLMVLRDHLMTMNRKLSKPLFVKMWRKLAEEMSKFMLEEVDMIFVVITYLLNKDSILFL